MDDFWFRLPGPARMVDELCRDFRVGCNVYYTVPDELRPYILSSFTEALSDNDLYSEIIDAGTEAAGDPFQVLRQFVSQDRQSSLIRPSDIATCDDLRFRLFVVYCDEQGRNPWNDFVRRYADAVHTHNRGGHAVFCLVSSGEWKGVRDDVFIQVKRWSDYFTDYDCEIFAAHHRAYRKDTQWVGRLASSLVAGLAQGDPLLAEHLADLELEALLSPDVMLRECTGSGMVIPGIPIHTADNITRRIWKAQVREVFPLLEELRHDLLSQARRQLASLGSLRDKDVRELELGQLNYYLRNTEWSDYARILADMRHKLAHLELIPYRDLQNALFARRSSVF